jgi:GH15 family glucan-1,4-alpha-glucosidase
MFVNSAPGEEVAQMNEYPMIADHGLNRDLQNAALVATDGTLDWFCSPRFDSPSIFASLLDHARGGHFSTRPLDEAFATKQHWVRDASFSVHTLVRMGFVDEAVAFSQWLRDRITERRESDTGPLDIMYRADGGPELHEEILPEWEGYRGS